MQESFCWQGKVSDREHQLEWLFACTFITWANTIINIQHRPQHEQTF